MEFDPDLRVRRTVRLGAWRRGALPRAPRSRGLALRANGEELSAGCLPSVSFRRAAFDSLEVVRVAFKNPRIHKT